MCAIKKPDFPSVGTNKNPMINFPSSTSSGKVSITIVTVSLYKFVYAIMEEFS